MAEKAAVLVTVVFVIPAVLAITSYGAQSAGEKVPSASVEGPGADALRGHSPEANQAELTIG